MKYDINLIKNSLKGLSSAERNSKITKILAELRDASKNAVDVNKEVTENIQDLIDQVRSENSNGIGAKCLYTDVLERFIDGKQTKQKVINDTDEEIVKVVENTSILDMVEPKFKVGDWVVDSQGLTHQIERVVENVTTHTFGYDIVGGGYFNDDNEGAHLWTIQDAKDGDVLVGNEDGVILMFRGIGNTEWDDVIDYHCYYDCHREDLIIQEDVEYWGNIENNKLKPATKEQRNFLFQKIKEASLQ